MYQHVHRFIVLEVKMVCSWSPKAKVIQSRVRKQNNCPSLLLVLFVVSPTDIRHRFSRFTWSAQRQSKMKIDCGLRTADCGLRTADCGLRTADCGLRTADCGLRTADCGLRTADCGLRTADCGLRTADCGLRAADWV